MASARDIYARYWRADKIELIGETDIRKLYRVTMKDPSGELHTLYAGEAFFMHEGNKALTPEEFMSWTKKAALAWLESGKAN